MQVADFAGLIDGYRRFRTNEWQSQHERWATLREGQNPRVMLISCSDSRVDPAQVFDTRPGEIFVVRNVAALVPPYETTPGRHGVSAALEFAVQVLKVSEIVVMGHGLCGGCQAALRGTLRAADFGEGGFVASWIALLDESRERVVAEHGTEGRAAERAMEQAAVAVSLANLRSFPWVREKEESGALTLHGAFFAISDGVLHVLDEREGRWSPAA